MKQRLSELSRQLYRNHFHLINTLTMAVDDYGRRLGTVDLGTEDSGKRMVAVHGGETPQYIVITWTTTEYGNIEANFHFIP